MGLRRFNEGVPRAGRLSYGALACVAMADGTVKGDPFRNSAEFSG